MMSKTYRQMFSEWRLAKEADGSLPLTAFTGAEMFAAHLDSFKDLTPELQVIAMLEAKNVDRACMSALIDALGQEKASQVLRPILARFHKTK